MAAARPLRLRTLLPFIRSPSLSPSRIAMVFLTDDTGKVLREEERAAENVYIQKMEREKMEKLRRKKLEEEAKQGVDSSLKSGGSTSEKK
eukprot:c30066_g1_i1 orf=74-343(+)